jgi:hypothetical protein
MDRTYCQCHVYDCPPGQATAVLVILADAGLRPEHGDGEPGSEDILSLDAPYAAGEFPCHGPGDLAARLRAEAPGCSFTAWSAPVGSWPGAFEAWAPALGAYRGTCNAGGVPVLEHEQAAAVIRSCPPGAAPADVLAALARAFGQPWTSDRDAAAGD